MKQDMIVILDLGSHENTVLARAIRALGVYSEIDVYQRQFSDGPPGITLFTCIVSS